MIQLFEFLWGFPKNMEALFTCEEKVEVCTKVISLMGTLYLFKMADTPVFLWWKKSMEDVIIEM